MGRLGPYINVVALAFLVFLIIFLPFPPELPVTAANFNYASVMFVGVVSLTGVDWLVRGRKEFRGSAVVRAALNEDGEKERRSNHEDPTGNM